MAKLVPDENERGKIIEESLFYKEAHLEQNLQSNIGKPWHLLSGGEPTGAHLFATVGAEELTEVEQRRSNDLLYVRYNMRLQECFKHLDTIDPISVIDIDDGNEWLVGCTDDARYDRLDECIGKEAVLEDTYEEEYFEQDDQSFDNRCKEDDLSYLTQGY